ncbi:MAG TPA: DUF1772 domain-containing protein [Rubricoccaceae bacterium]|nr:DUF1772 domain-containing protein [Rubricoccaceae bacterium]
MAELAEFLAVIACALFAGAAVYINLVEHPARLSFGTAIAATQWAPSYKRATVMQVPLAVLAAVGGALRWAVGGDVWWLVGALLILAVIPFTVLIILPTNNRLLEPQRDRASAETQRLLEGWGRLHAVRSVMSVAALGLFVWLLVRT